MIITLFGKSIKFGKNPNQLDMFAGAEKEFAPGDKRKLEITGSGKLRWKNADGVDSGQSSVVSGKSAYQEEIQSKYENAKINLGIDDDLELLNELEKRLKMIPEPNMNRVMTDDKEAEKLTVRNRLEEIIRFVKKKNNIEDKPNRDQLYYQSKNTDWLKKKNSAIYKIVLDGKATDRELKINDTILDELGKREENKSNKKIDDDKIAELYRNSPISIQVDKMSNKAQEIFNNARSSEGRKIAYDLWNYGNEIQDEFVEKYVKGEKISNEDVMEVKKIANILIKGAEEEFEKTKSSGKAKISIKKKKADRPRVETVKNPVQSEPDLVKKELDKLKEEYESKNVEELVTLKKKLYPDMDIESPMSPEEKLLDRVIAQKFGEINQQIIKKRNEQSSKGITPKYNYPETGAKLTAKDFSTAKENDVYEGIAYENGEYQGRANEYVFKKKVSKKEAQQATESLKKINLDAYWSIDGDKWTVLVSNVSDKVVEQLKEIKEAEIFKPQSPNSEIAKEKPVKQPHEMTQREYLIYQRKDFGTQWNVAYEFEVPKEHKALIEQAIKQGKSVPAEVLKDYPDLVTKQPYEMTAKEMYRKLQVWSEEKINNYNPEDAVEKGGVGWRVKTITGNYFPGSFTTKKEAVEQARYHKNTIKIQFENASKSDLKRLEADLAIKMLNKYYIERGLSDTQVSKLSEYKAIKHSYHIQQALSEGKQVPEEVLADYPELKPKKEKVKITDVTPKGYGPAKAETTSTIYDKLKGETTDQAIERNVGYQIENGKVKLEQDAVGWKATIYQGDEPQIIRAYKKQDVLNKVFKNLNPDAKFEEDNVTKSIFKNLFKAFGKQLSFGAQPYQKEGQTKEGRGGTLKLTRDSSGKGAHWRLANKKQLEGRGQRESNQAVSGQSEKQSGGKIITPAIAYELLQNKIGNSVLVQDNEGNLLGNGSLQLVHENDGNYQMFVKEANGFDSLVPIPKNQAVIHKDDEINFKFADKKIVVSTKEKSKIPNKPIEMEKAEQNAKHARNLEKMRNYNEWQKQAESYAKTAQGQKDWFFGDLEIAADAEGLDFGISNRQVKTSEVLFKEIKRNATRADKAEIYSALIGAFEVKSINKAKAVIANLKQRGYEIDNHQLSEMEKKDSFFTRLKISKGENDPLPKELQFATAEYALAFNECLKKPNPLRETEMSLGLKIEAEAVPEFNKIKKELFSKAGEGLGQMWITGGLPGSGKSTVLGGEFYKNKVLVDPDKIKYMIAEARGISKKDVDLRPWELHEESSAIAKHLVREAVREKKDVIYDVTMKGTENLNDILYLVNSDTFQANAEFIHVPIETGIERDKKRGEAGGRSIGVDLYKKLFGDYPTHKAFFQLKDSFDNFRVHDNSVPLGEQAKLFYEKEDGEEKIIYPELHEEFKKNGLSKLGKSLYLKHQRRKLMKSLDPQNEELPTNEKLKQLLEFPKRGIDREIDSEQDFFSLGMLKMHGLIDENMELTPKGEEAYQKEYGNKFTNLNGESLDEVVNPKKNIAEENNGKSIKAFGKELKL